MHKILFFLFAIVILYGIYNTQKKPIQKKLDSPPDCKVCQIKSNKLTILEHELTLLNTPQYVKKYIVDVINYGSDTLGFQGGVMEGGYAVKEDADKIVANAGFDIKRIDEIEAVTRHDLIAFTTSVSETLGEESRWFHYGMTSSDTIDTAVALQMKDSLALIIEDVKMLMESIKKRAMEHKMTLMVGRSHGIHGEPITFGLVLAIWYDEMKRHLENLEQTMEVISVGQVSGAMGNFAHAPLELEEYTCEELGLKPAPASNQVIQRDR